MKIKLILTAIRGFYEKCTQAIENTEFLILRFLHIFIKTEKKRNKYGKSKINYYRK